MTVRPIDRRSSLARARLSPRRSPWKLRARRVMSAGLIALPLSIFLFPRAWFVVALLWLFDVTAFILTDDRPQLPRGSNTRNRCGA